MLYYYESLIHLARNYRDMCDEISINKVSEYLEISESIRSFICCCDCKLTEETLYVLNHNIAKMFCHKAEKIDSKYLKTAQEIYEYVLEMDYVKKNKELLAIASAYKTVYHYSGEQKDFLNALEFSNGIVNKVKYNSQNSLLLQRKLSFFMLRNVV